MAKKEENTPKAPRLSTIERLQLQLAEAEAKQKERDAKKVAALKEQYTAAQARLDKELAKVNELAAKLAKVNELENPDTTDGVDVSDGVGEPTESE